jgi:hypothetical protein
VPYLDEYKCLDKILQEAENQVNAEKDQTKSFIALVQASLSGKTRMLIEISLRRPLILISFQTNNKAYEYLLQIIPHNYEATFERVLHRNRLIFVYTRLFYLSYLHFFQLYFNGDWMHSTEIDKKAFAALLINGGGTVVKDAFIELISHYNFATLDFSEEKVISSCFLNTYFLAI